MELREFISMGNVMAGEQKKLAVMLGVTATNIADAKAGRRGLPAHACVKLGSILGIEPMTIIAASELVTEKNPERRAVFAPFVMDSANDAILHRVKNGAKAVARASSLT